MQLEMPTGAGGWIDAPAIPSCVPASAAPTIIFPPGRKRLSSPP